MERRGSLILHEDIVAVRDEELNGLILHLRVCHFAGKRLWTHNGRREDNGDV